MATVSDHAREETTIRTTRTMLIGTVLVTLLAAALLSGCAENGEGEPVAAEPASSVAEKAPKPTPTPEMHTLTGTLTVEQDTYVDNAETAACIPGLASDLAVTQGITGYEDIDAGAQVTVYDGAQSIIATTSLSAGVLAEVTEARQVADLTNAGLPPDVGYIDFESFEDYVARSDAAYAAWEASMPQFMRYWGYCQFSFQTEVTDADFYSVEVADRGTINYSRAELEAANWTVALVL